MSRERISVSLTAGKLLVFEIEDVKRLRNLGICGVLTGTLPTAPQQNTFLGLPLQLMVEEVIWLSEQDLLTLIPEKSFINAIVEDLNDDDIKYIQRSRADSFQIQKEQKIQQKNEKLRSVHQESQKFPSDLLISQSLFIRIADTPSQLPNFDFFKSIYCNSPGHLALLKSLQYDRLNYLMFKHLRSNGYFLAPGMRFGGKFIGYPGDPLRYHAHLVVNTVPYDKDIGLMNIVNGGRLATGVKKIWLIGSAEMKDKEEKTTNEDEEPICFSVEWAGFG